MRILACFAALFIAAGPAAAADIRLLASTAFPSAIEKLEPLFAKSSGDKLVVTYATSGGVRDGVIKDPTAFDVAIASADALDALAAQGKLDAATRIKVSQIGIGVMVPAHANKPNIATPEAFKAALLAAPSVVFSDPAGGGASGKHAASIIEKLGIAEQIKPKLKLVPAAKVAETVVKGEAALGILTTSEILPLTGVIYVGPLPGELQSMTPFNASVTSGAKNADGAKAFVKFLQSPAAQEAMRAAGHAPP